MPRPDNVPEHLWISDSLVIRPGGHQRGNSRLPWTPELAARAWAMHENGDPWNEIARMLYEQTGVRLADRAVADYLLRHFEG